MGQQHRAGWSQPDLPRVSLQQLKPELALQSLDPLRESRLRDVETLGGPAEMARRGDLHECTKLAKLHYCFATVTSVRGCRGVGPIASENGRPPAARPARESLVRFDVREDVGVADAGSHDLSCPSISPGGVHERARRSNGDVIADECT